jgi:hypothetical protein
VRLATLWPDPARPIAPPTHAGDPDLQRVDHACYRPLMRLVEELALSCRYHAATFPATPLSELIFLGGGATDHRICQRLAMELHLAAHSADPVSRLAASEPPATDPSTWPVAIGLSLAALDKAA